MPAGTHTLLVDQPATPAQRRTIGAASVVLTLIAIGVLPLAGRPLVRMPEMAAVFGSVVAVTDLITCLLLATRAGNDASPSIRAIACAYLFSGLMAVLHVCTFPGALLTDAPLVGRRDTVGLLFLAWRFGFALLLLIGVSLDRRGDPRPAPAAMLKAALATVAVVALCLFLALWIPEHLPNAQGGAFGRGPWLAAWTAVAICATALLVIWRTRRLRRTLYLWIGFVLLASALGLCMSETGGARFTVGWYAGRGYVVLASCVVLALLLQEVLTLQRTLSTSVTMLGQRAQELQSEIHRREAAERKLERASQLELIGRLAGGVAHDFNNHLHIIGTRLELLRRRAGGVAGVADDMAVVARTLRRAQGLTQHLLSLSGRRALQPQRLQLAHWLPASADVLRSVLPANVALDVHVPADAWPVDLDPGELESALTNLVGNARDAFQGAPGRVELRVRNHAADGTVEIAVSDDGCGMPRDVAQRAFEPFFSTKESGRGYGLGLSQVQSFVERSRGSVSIDSEPGDGTTVQLRFARAEPGAEPALPAPADSRAMPLDNPIHGQPLLVVEDDDDVAAATGALLAHIGLVVRRVAHAQEALDLLGGDWQPRFVLTDIMMPGAINGLELARRLRRERPQITVVLCSGYSQVAGEARDDGFVVLMKPYQPAELERLIAKALRTTQAPAVGASAS